MELTTLTGNGQRFCNRRRRSHRPCSHAVGTKVRVPAFRWLTFLDKSTVTAPPRTLPCFPLFPMGDSGGCRAFGGHPSLTVKFCKEHPGPEYTCGICWQTTDGPSSCGHACAMRACYDCMNRALRGSCDSKCPTCRQPTLKPVCDLVMKAQLGRMEVFCPQHDVGCSWRGPLDQWSKHDREECAHATERCICGQVMLRSQFAEHQAQCLPREVKCGRCQTMLTMGQLSVHHMQECKEVRLQCLICGDCVIRKDCAQHRTLGCVPRHLARVSLPRPAVPVFLHVVHEAPPPPPAVPVPVPSTDLRRRSERLAKRPRL